MEGLRPRVFADFPASELCMSRVACFTARAPVLPLQCVVVRGPTFSYPKDYSTQCRILTILPGEFPSNSLKWAVRFV
jgi:hypothetical protein